MSVAAQNLLAWFAQVSLVAAAGALLPSILQLRSAAARLAYWQMVLLLCLALPLLAPLQPWPAAPGAVAANTTQMRPVSGPGVADIPYEKIGLAILAGGILLRWARLGAGLARLRAWRKAGRPIEHSLPSRLGVPAHVAVSGNVAGPVTFGWRRPLILVPPNFLSLPADQQESALCHELIHVRRRDWIITVVEEGIRAAFWFHPAIWWLLGQIQLAREQTVDREVVRLMGSREAYLQALIATAGAQAYLDLAPAPLFLKKRHLARRVGALMKKENPMSKSKLIFSMTASLVMVLAAGVGAVALFPLRSAAGQESAALTVYRNMPAYPAEAKAKGVQGRVIIEVADREKGEFVFVSGPPELREAALRMARESSRKEARLTYDFVLQDAPDSADSFAPPENGVKRIPIGGNVQARKLVHKVAPVYPREAKEAGIQGTVVLQVVIAKDGAVREVRVISGESLLAEASVEAIRQWRYEKTLLNGEPVEVLAQIDVNFTLAQ